MSLATYAPAEAAKWWTNRATAADVSAARRWVRTQLAARGLDGPVVDDAVLVASELLTNAAQHAGGEAELTLLVEADRLTLTCGDRAVHAPALLEADDVDEHHRGLLIVAALAEDCQMRPRRDGGNRIIVRLAIGDTP